MHLIYSHGNIVIVFCIFYLRILHFLPINRTLHGTDNGFWNKIEVELGPSRVMIYQHFDYSQQCFVYVFIISCISVRRVHSVYTAPFEIFQDNFAPFELPPVQFAPFEWLKVNFAPIKSFQVDLNLFNLI